MDADLVETQRADPVVTVTMNDPRRLNGWTREMQEAIGRALAAAAADPDIGAVILTGTGRYYSAGVNLSGALAPAHPRTFRRLARDANYQLFDRFIQFPKPILAAVNGPTIGAATTTAVLCDAILASEEATFSTPFHRVGLPPEGCSSVLFPRLFGEEAAERMLGREGWKPSAAQALEIGLAKEVLAPEALLPRAQELAAQWVAEGRPRTIRGGLPKEELERINAEESEGVADGLLSASFLMGQYRFLRSRKKYGPAMTFLALRATRPLWGQMLR
ncbi:MAG: enoyl-CoA hydratase/isomerase family protein [Sandaracinaceae bacterium]